MKIIIGVRFRTAGKVYFFAPGDIPVRRGSHVIVETARGVEYGTVTSDPIEMEEKKISQPLKSILRLATAEDEERETSNREKEHEAYRVAQEKIRKHNLDMKLISAEYTFDNSKILFYFTADGRVDFRDLVKDLAGVFRTRIELRQIGVRDETKILGGIGICGRALCCHSYLSDFVPVSIKMAKEQSLSLNPTKISGTCGRLMCCLKNEEDTYEELNRNLPGLGDEVQSADGLIGEVEGVSVLRQTVKILVEVDDEKELHEYPVEEITILRKRKRGTARKSMKDNGNHKENKPDRGGKDTTKQRDDKGNDDASTKQGGEGRPRNNRPRGKRDNGGRDNSGRENSGRENGGRANGGNRQGNRQRPGREDQKQNGNE